MLNLTRKSLRTKAQTLSITSILLVFHSLSGCFYSYPLETDSGTDSNTEIATDTNADTESNTESHSGADICPIGIEFVSTPAFTELATSSREGTEYIDSCPKGQIVIGFQGFMFDDAGRLFHGRIRTVCGAPSVSLIDDRCVVEMNTGASLPTRGSAGDVEWTRMCPQNEMIMGYQAWTGSDIDQIVFRCAPLRITGDGNGHTVTRGPFTDLGPVGADSGTSTFQADCPDGQIATIADFFADGFLRAIALGCQVPVLVH